MTSSRLRDSLTLIWGLKPYRCLHQSFRPIAIPGWSLPFPAPRDAAPGRTLSTACILGLPLLGPSSHRSPVPSFVNSPLVRRPHHLSCSLQSPCLNHTNDQRLPREVSYIAVATKSQLASHRLRAVRFQVLHPYRTIDRSTTFQMPRLRHYCFFHPD